MMKKVFFIGVIFIIFLSPKQICAETTYDSNFVEINNSWYDEEYGDGHVYIPSYSNIGCVSDSENQIYLYYDYYGMDNNVVNQVFLDILEIYTYFCCELNYNNPISGSSQKFNIYFDYQSEFTDSKGYAQSNNPIFTLDYFGYIVINYDELLKDVISGFHINTLAHEFFHTICYRYEMSDNTGIIGWFMECSATAVGVKYYCDKFGIEKETLNSECELFCRGHMQQYLGTTNVSLVGSNANENVRNLRGYDTYMFLYLMMDLYGDDCLKQILERYKDNGDIMNSIDETLDAFETSLEEYFSVFVKYNIAPNISYADHLGEYCSLFDDNTMSINFDENMYNYSFSLPYLSVQYFELYLRFTDNEDYIVDINTEYYEGIDIGIIYLNQNDTLEYEMIDDLANDNRFIINKEDIQNRKRVVIFICNNKGENEDIINSIKVEKINIRNLQENENFLLFDENSKYNDYFLGKYVPKESDLYNFKLDLGIDNFQYFEKLYEILDSEGNVIFKFNDYIQEMATNSNDNNEFNVWLKKDEIYYVRINYCDALNGILTISTIKDSNCTYQLTESLSENLKNIHDTESVYIFNANHTGKFLVNFELTNTYNNSFKLIVFKKHAENIDFVFNGEISEEKQINSELILFEGSRLYICIFGTNIENVICDVNIARLVETNINLWTDPNENVTLGSEVSMNGGIFQGITITQGYTRCIYINEIVNSKSRLDYFWYSSNENVAKVSEYGTVTAVSENENIVTIYAVYKADPTKVGQITFTILPDLTTHQINVVLTTDVRTGGVVSGTQVTENGGLPGDVDLNVGYTRLICFYSNSPTNSIQDFIWTSSNENVVTVSEFGTILAVGEGEAYIYGVYKYNDNFIAQMYVYVN